MEVLDEFEARGIKGVSFSLEGQLQGLEDSLQVVCLDLTDQLFEEFAPPVCIGAVYCLQLKILVIINDFINLSVIEFSLFKVDIAVSVQLLLQIFNFHLLLESI